jgi:general secretion pathway protein G
MKTVNCNSKGSCKSGKKGSKGFTLIEILIVVIILGILAAIVIPQFTNASTAAKQSAVSSTAQTLRSQIALYKLQHTDKMPGEGAAVTPPALVSDQFWTDMTTQTDATGAPYVAGATTGPFGPYMQTIPVNSLNGSTLVIDGTTPPGSSTSSTCGYVYQYTGTLGVGTGTGALYGTGIDQKSVQP